MRKNLEAAGKDTSDETLANKMKNTMFLLMHVQNVKQLSDKIRSNNVGRLISDKYTARKP